MDFDSLTSHDYTILFDRILWRDGDSSLLPEDLKEFMLYGKSLDGIFSTKIDDDIKSFNRLNDCSIRVKPDIRNNIIEWKIPDHYKNIDIETIIFLKLENEILSMSSSDSTARLLRVEKELELFEEFGIFEILKVIHYIIETFENNDVVWGTGRGSSCASYVLYLLGLHDVDCILYDIDLKEFFRNK